MTSSEIRQSFLDFFREQKHTLVPSSSLLPDGPNLLFTNAGMNQFVPIFLGQAPCPYQPARAADTQKCIRAGGKHNDLEDVGLDTYHHTFFEMLGNWSFGDYFKKEAITWAWELVVNRWNFPASRVFATVYQPGKGDPASFDQEAYDEWARIFTAAGLDPKIHIVNGNKKDNFWMMGETGPCGPCSELHIDLTPGPRELDVKRQKAGAKLVNRGDARCIEIWNLVFIQFNANPDGTFVPLPARHVDTGMGLERVVSMIQGTKGLTDFSQSDKISNYETDVFRPLFSALEKLTGKKYTSTLPASLEEASEQEKTDIAFRVIADHIRTLSFAIADGIQPSNEGRGYVLRRILRRAVRYGRNLGLREPFLAQLVPVLVETMGPVFPEIVKQAETVKSTLTNEEKSFITTLERGLGIFDEFTSQWQNFTKFSRNVDLLLKVIENYEKDSVFFDEFLTASKPLAEIIKKRGEYFEDELLREALETDDPLRQSLEVFISVITTAKSNREYDYYNIAVYLDSCSKLSDLINALEEITVDSVAHDLTQQLHDNIETIRRGVRLVTKYENILLGTIAFKLYDTYGFPLDLTELMARERGLTVDTAEFDRLMEEQKARGKAAQKKEIISAVSTAVDQLTATVFTGFDELQTASLVLAVENDLLAVSETPFYAEMGGQVGDTGEVQVGSKKVAVINTIKSPSGQIIFHKLAAPLAAKPDERVTLHVDAPRRARISAHHSGTHLLHWALRKVLGPTVSQKGSYVGPDRFRFDFAYGAALTPEQLAEVEKLVNEKIEANVPVQWDERPYAEVKGDPSILQFFGDKYGERVRVVSIGDFSRELCGGTHVRRSEEVGFFKILSESAISAGVRRVEAATGPALIEHVHEQLLKQEEQHSILRKRKLDLALLNEFSGEKTAAAFWQHYEKREADLQQAAASVAQHEKDEAKRQEAGFQKRAADEIIALVAAAKKINDVPFLTHLAPETPAGYLPVLADTLKNQWPGVAVLAAVSGDKVALLASVAPAYTKKIQAGKIIQAIAPLVGGKGGGRPELAQGGGTNPAGLPAAFAKAEEMLR